jgi:hypothetical protein
MSSEKLYGNVTFKVYYITVVWSSCQTREKIFPEVKPVFKS